MISLSEAAARLSRAAIALKKRREKDALARKHRKKIAAFFRMQKGMVLEEMEKQKYLFSESFRRLTEETIIDFTVQNWDRIWEDISNLSTKDLQTLIASAEADGLIQGAEQLKKSLPFDAKTNFNLANPRAVQWFADNGGSLQYIKNIQDTTRDQLQVIITKAIDEGKSYTQTAKEISEKFDDFTRDRAQRIAVYETGQAYEEGNMLFSQSLKDDGLVMKKKWMTSHDEKVRPEHAANEAEDWIPIDQYHQTGDFIPPSDPGCRCYEIYEQASAE